MLNGLNINITVSAPNVQQTTNVAAQGLNQVTQAAKATTNQVKEMRGEFVQVAGAFTGLAVGKQILGVLGAFANKADAVTTGMAKIRSVTQLQDGEEKSLKKTILSVSEATGNSFADVAEASKDLLAQSLNPKQVEAVLGPLFKLAKVGDLGVESATNLVVSLGNLGVMGDKIAPAFDVMLNLSNKSSLNVKDFVDVMTKAGPQAAVLGVDFKDLAQAAALLRRGFASGAEEGTALNGALLAMTQPKKLKALGELFNVPVINKTTGAMRPLMSIFQDIAKAVDPNQLVKSQGMLSQIFGSRTGGRVIASAVSAFQHGMQFGDTFKQGKELFSSLNEEANNSAGSLDHSFSERMRTMTETFGQLSVAIDNLMGVLGKGFADTLTSLASGLTNVISSIRDWLMANPALASTLGTIVGLIAQFAAGFAIFMTFFGAIKLVGFGMAFLRTSMLALTTAMSVLPEAAGKAAFGLVFARSGILSLGGAAAVARVALGSLWRALIGPFGLILLLFDVLPMIGKWLGIGAAGTDKTLSTAEAMKMTSKNLDDASNGMKDAADQLSIFAEKLKESIALYSGAFMKKPMVIDPKEVRMGQEIITEFSKRTGTPMSQLTPLVKALDDQVAEARAAAKTGGTVPLVTMERALQAQRILGGDAALIGMSKHNKFFEDITHNAETGASLPNTLHAATTRAMGQGFSPLDVFGKPMQEQLTTTPNAVQLMKGPGGSVAPVFAEPPTVAKPRNIFKGFEMLQDGKTVKSMDIDDVKFNNVQFNAPVRVNIGGTDVAGAIQSADDHSRAHGFGTQ